MKSDFLKILQDRGFIHQTTDSAALDTLLSQTTISAYIGFDATATSLHVGSLVQIMMLRWLQKTGHRPIVLMGGATSKIGDPTWKNTARPLLDDAAIDKNIQGIAKVFSKYLQFGQGPTDAMIVNNNDWLAQINYMDFLRDYGRHFSINRMLTFDSVKMRLEQENSLSFLEFNYMILQAFDFKKLKETYNCQLQMGGADQWGNIINGVELTRRTLAQEVFGLTSPLITTSSGAKMGKTANGAVWLNSENLPIYDYWQFWRNTEDGDVGRYLRLFTELPMDEIVRLEQLQGAEINHAKKVLADAATTLAHGSFVLADIHTTVAKIFEHQAEGDLTSLPCITLSSEEWTKPFTVIDALCGLNFATSKGEARRLIQGKAIRVNNELISDTEATLSTNHLVADGYIKLSSGKKRHGIIYLPEKGA